MAVSKEEWKVVTEAAQNGDIAAVRAYLDAGGDVNRNDGIGGATLLMWSTLDDRADIAALLLERGADINIVDTNERETALMWAGATGAEKVLGLILGKNPPIEQTNKGGWTALVCAAYSGRPGTARLLLEAGASTDVTDREGKTLMERATEPTSPNASAEEGLRKVETAAVIRGVIERRAREQQIVEEAREAAIKLTADTVEACRNGASAPFSLSRKLVLKTPISAG